MKKIVGTILAASLALTAFAAEPAANFVIAEFTGSAEFGWKANMLDTSKISSGMYNEDAANLKLGFVTAGDKTTTGDGVWGELGIKFEKPLEWNFTKDAKPTQKELPVPSFAAPAVSTAKIHFVDGDFSAALNIMKPDLKYGEFAAPAATGSSVKTNKIGEDDNLKAGFAVELAMKDMFGLNVKFMDNGQAVNKIAGLAFDASLDAIKDLTAKVYGSFNFDREYVGLAVEAGYKWGINDTLYLKPGAAYTFSTKKDQKFASNSLEAGVLFGWGAEGQEPGLSFISNKTNEGVSVGVSNNLTSGCTSEDGKVKDGANNTVLKVGLYDQSLFKLLGIEEYGTLKTGIYNETTFGSSYSKTGDLRCDTSTVGNKFAIGAAFNADLGPAYIELGGGVEMKASTLTTKYSGTGADAMAETGKETDKLYNKANELNTQTVWSVKIGTKKVIDNTDLYVLYDGTYNKDYTKKDITKNDIKIGAKIFF